MMKQNEWMNDVYVRHDETEWMNEWCICKTWW